MPARKSQANQSEKVREAQEKTKKLMADNDLQDAFTGAITTRLVTGARAKARSRYDVQEKQEGEQKRTFSPADPPKVSRPRTRQKPEPKPKPKPKPVVITIDDDDSMSQDSFAEASSAAPPRKRARGDTPSYYSPRVVFGRMDYADVQWEIRWEQAELAIRTVKQLTADDDGDPYAFDDGDGDYAPDEPKQRNAKRKECQPLARAAPKATEDREFHIPYTDLARVAELTSTGLVAVRTRTILSQIDSYYYDPQNRDGSRHYIHIYCSNGNEWREEWHKVKTILAEASIKTASITRFISTKKIITYPPGRSRDVVTLTQADVERLEPEQLLNDNIIEFYLKYLYEEALFPDNAPQRDQFYFFNTFFWPKLQSLKSEDQMKNLLSWTRNVDIFKKRFLFVPINDGFHWNVVAICNPGSIVHAQTPGAMDKLPKEEWPVMVHMCSLHSTAGHVFNKLRAYLGVAWNADDSRPSIKVTKDSLLGFIPNLPEQQNGSDCGVFLLQYVEGFCRNPPTLYTKEDLKVTLNRSWFDNETITQKRREIKDLIARIACEQEPVTDEPEQAEGPKDEAEAAAATTTTTQSSAGDASVKSGSSDEGEAPPSCGGEVEVYVVGEETNKNETRMDSKNEDEDGDDDNTQLPIERGGVEAHTGVMEVEEAEEREEAARDDSSLGSDLTPPSPLSLNSAPVSSDDEMLKELVAQEADDRMPTSGAARRPSPGLSPPRSTTTREVAMADLDEGEGEGSGETPGMELKVARWTEKRKRKGEERRRETKKVKKATAGRGGDGERDQSCASRAEDDDENEAEEEERGSKKAVGYEGDSDIDIWVLSPRLQPDFDPVFEANASKQRDRERDDNDEEEEGEGKTTKKRWAKRRKREENGSSGMEDEAEEAVITAVVPASSSSTSVRASTVDTSAARPSGRTVLPVAASPPASPHRQKVPIGDGGQTVVVDIGEEEKEEGEQRKAKEEKEKRAAQSRSRGATGTKGESWWSIVRGSLSGLRSAWPTTTPGAAVGPAGESMHGQQLILAPLPPPGQDEDPLLNRRDEEGQTMATPTPTPTTTPTPTSTSTETTMTSSAENDISSSGSGKRKRLRKRRRKGKHGSQADDSLSSEASLPFDGEGGEGGSPVFHVVYDAVAVADREAAHGRWDTTAAGLPAEVKEEANDGEENEQASEEMMRNAVEEEDGGGGKEEEEANDDDSGTISDPHPGRLRHANGPRCVAGRTKTKEGLAMKKVTKKGKGTPKPAIRTLVSQHHKTCVAVHIALASNLKNKFEELAKPPPEPERKKTGGKVGWNDPAAQGQKKVHKGGHTVIGNGPPPKKSLTDLP
ncbi:uncharacterized protein ACA1_164210 [Acanthamoeba castellanii str. Neff]|uniref:Ubiquitin-like protease family profile domain-containing protein n=1 Tax=Acanthamoeba castellanii (strain ATCC 30010 / Neff) TaxID=1257118 RepID=L8GRM5_ACACF|nr:uncharacterized protein ACA1_164210 [Acanthamoeba castellanii str. Neff]ELR15572.1 hypothetical protein ACA1_164210 [Acanthamoeba castellanii str. Neff]